ncbi:uncharacterized protein HMPREF1541_02286 [Cyphellophora europaea CBS 101466]|uniref:Uncharacterized protein n=1 Tax=Cyphellophora europaea (strain CBS 101466) TaxID=1220924 RepID=W2S506_CYPE1|nr:uncharacterized protein HMPREF1541_02286 [Cyphellophora europaea CBS 101466]ETN43128.1 hypothetical protein HMPREF1541_02286 [Cyphellophora europaea CBS 101466]
MATPSDDSGIADLCQKTKNLVPQDLGSEAWTLLAGAIIAQSTKPHHLATLYTHLTTTDPNFNTPASRTRLSLRFRDLLLKQVTLVGAPQVLCAVIPLAKADASDHGAQHASVAAAAQASTLSPQWHDISVPAIHARGSQTIDTIYGPLLPSIFDSFGAHSADVQFMELFSVYGMYLSEFTHLTPLETELVVFVTIMCTGLRGPGLWHMRGMGRLLGARGTDEGTEQMRKIKDQLRDVKVAAMEVVEWLGEEMVVKSGLNGGMDGRGWANVGDVVRELGGWGDDPLPAA